MTLSNKLRFHLGMESIVLHRGKYLVTKRAGLIFGRVFFDAGDGDWWMKPYPNSYFNTIEEAHQALGKWEIKPV